MMTRLTRRDRTGAKQVYSFQLYHRKGLHDNGMEMLFPVVPYLVVEEREKVG